MVPLDGSHKGTLVVSRCAEGLEEEPEEEGEEKGQDRKGEVSLSSPCSYPSS